MTRSYTIALVLAGSLAVASGLFAQVPPSSNPAGSGQNKPPAAQKPPAAPAPSSPAPATSAPTGANPFPEDTSSVPVMPSKDAAPLPEGTYGGGAGGGAPLAAEDTDPVRSPEEAGKSAGNGQGDNSSSSQAGLDAILPPGSDDDQTDNSGKRRKLSVKDQPHTESASEDVNVGKYYLESKNWKAALSRFQSAMVLDPENPEAYWGIAEADRHLSDFADARTYYQKLLDYDPDGPHGKEARKALKDPQIANAKSPSIGQAAAPSK